MSKGPFEYSGGATGGGDVTSVFGRTGDVVAENGDYTASQVTNVPAGNISSTDVQGAINELDTEKAPTFTVDASLTYAANVLGRAALTGDVTASAGSNATMIANSAVTNAKMANMAASTVKANPTGGSAAPQDVTLDGTLEFNSTTLRRAAITGPVAVAAGSNVSTMTANSTALAALANAAAQYDIIGRKTASGGAWEDCTRAQLNIAGTDLTNTFLLSQLVQGIVVSSGSAGNNLGRGRLQARGGNTAAGDGGIFEVYNNSSATLAFGNKSAVLGSAYDSQTCFFSVNGFEFMNSSFQIGMKKFDTGSLSVGVGAADIGTGAINAIGAIRCGQFTVATLPAAATVGAGAQAYVTDATANTYGAALTGGGSTKAPVNSTGSAWQTG